MKSQQAVAGLILACAAVLSGCVAHAHGYGSAEADSPVFVEPELVAVDDIWVVRDYDAAVYYVDDSYWVYRDDSWYRSGYYDRGWTAVTFNIVPTSIARRRHDLYVHYRGDAQARTRRAPPSHRDDRDGRDRPGGGDRQRPDGMRHDQGGRGPPQADPRRDERKRDKRDDKRDKKRDHDR